MNHAKHTFMRDKKLSSVLRDAIDSPVGSTKRKAAKNLIAVMDRVMSKRDGIGGPGYGYYGQGGPGSPLYSPTTPGSASFVTKAPRKDPDYSNMIIFPSPPAPRRGNPLTKAMVPTAQSGQEYLDRQVQAAVGGQQPALSPRSNFNPSTLPDISGAFSDVVGSKLDGQGGPGWTPPASAFPTLASPESAPAPKFNTFSPISTEPKKDKSSSLLTGVNPLFPNISSAGGAARPQTPGLFPSLQVGQPFTPGVPPTPVGGPMTPERREELRAQGAAKGETPTTPTTPTLPTPPTPPTPSTPPTPPTKEPAPQAGAKASLDAGLKANMGATTWAQSAMANPELMKEIFPGITGIPESGSLTESINNLQSTLKEQYNIKGMQDQLLEMTANGVTLGPMLQTYIQNKDVSLNKIHDQMLDAQGKILSVDQGNPYEVAIWSKYSDYLNNLYTAQNASYADFFNKSVTMYDKALSALNTTLSNSLTQYNNELTLKAGLAEADYNRIYQGLTDMYTTAQEAPAKELQIATMRAQLALANKQLLDAGSTTGQGDWVAEYKKLTDMGILFDNATGEGGNSNARYGTLMPDVTNLGEMMQTIISDNPKIGVDGALYIIGQAFQKSLQSADATKAVAEANRFQGMILEAVSDGYIPQAMGLQMVQSLAPSVSKSISGFFSDAGRADTAKSAMKDALVGSGWFGKKVPSLIDFEKRYSEQLTKELADAIYQQMNDTKSIISTSHASPGGQGATGTSPYAGKTVEEIYNELADEIDTLSTPEDVGNYVSNLVTPAVIGKGVMALQPVGT